MWGSQDMRQSEALLQQPLFPDDYLCAVEHDPGTVIHYRLLGQPCRIVRCPAHTELPHELQQPHDESFILIH